MILRLFKYSLITLYILIYTCTLYSQDNNSSIRIKDIKIEGNKKTRISTILRELDFQIGDTISINKISKRLGKNQKLLLNTGLFYTAIMNIKDWDENYIGTRSNQNMIGKEDTNETAKTK